jgi:hypothetical protein
MSDVIVIDRRFHSWPTIAHGGYVAGHLAARIDGAAEITLRGAVPFDRALTIERAENGGVVLCDDGRLLVRAVPKDLVVDVPAPATFEEAEGASWTHHAIPKHPTPTCFCCGYERAEGDALRIWPGSLAGRDEVAAAWTPHRAFAAEDGSLSREFIWAALDCPSFWGIVQSLHAMPNVVTIRLAGQVLAPIRCGEPHVVMGWAISHKGRQMLCGSAIFGPSGDLRAVGRATWLRVRALPSGIELI